MIEAYLLNSIVPHEGLNGWGGLFSEGGSSMHAHVGGVIDDKFYITTGRATDDTTNLKDTWVFDPMDNSWERLRDCPVSLYSAAAAVINGKLYVYGGSNSDGRQSSLYTYDPKTDRWASLKANRTLYAHACCECDGKLYAVAGYTGKYTTILDCYDPETDTWEELPDVPLPARSYHTAVGYKGEVYVFGGSPGGSSTQYLKDAYCYNVASKTWRRLADMPNPRASMASVVFKDKIYLLGGRNINSETPDYSLMEYDPVLNTWTGFEDTHIRAWYPVAGVINEAVYLYSGSHNQFNMLRFI